MMTTDQLLEDSSAEYMQYFLYSAEQFKIRKQIESKIGNDFKPGIVIVNGQQKEFTEMAKTVNSNRYSDTKIITYGDIRTIKYNMPE